MKKGVDIWGCLTYNMSWSDNEAQINKEKQRGVAQLG